MTLEKQFLNKEYIFLEKMKSITMNGLNICVSMLTSPIGSDRVGQTYTRLNACVSESGKTQFQSRRGARFH